MPEKFFITTAIPYTNAEPHIGHLLEFVCLSCSLV
ncbi:MAG: class I tRNA ligase family protein [Patescibacteria group bacterium]